MKTIIKLIFITILLLFILSEAKPAYADHDSCETFADDSWGQNLRDAGWALSNGNTGRAIYIIEGILYEYDSYNTECPFQIASLHKRLGDLYYQIGRNDKTKTEYLKALPAFEGLSFAGAAAVMRITLGDLAWQEGQLDDALTQYQAAEKWVATSQGLDEYKNFQEQMQQGFDPPHQSELDAFTANFVPWSFRAAVAGRLAQLYSRRGLATLAKKYSEDETYYYEQDLKYWQDIPSGLSDDLPAFSLPAFAGGKIARATIREGIAKDNLNIGMNEIDRHNYDNALSHLENALFMYRQLQPEKTDEVILTLQELAIAYEKQGNFDQAIKTTLEVLPQEQSIHDKLSEAQTLTDLGRLYKIKGDTVSALNYSRQAIDLYEAFQSLYKTEDYRLTIAYDATPAYEQIVQLLLTQGGEQNIALAFEYSERERARTFLDLLETGPIAFRPGADADLIVQEQLLRDKWRDAYQKVIDDPSNDDAYQNLQIIEEKRILVIEKLRSQNPVVATMLTVSVSSLADIVNLLNKDVVLVDYFVTNDVVYAFVIHDQKTSVVKLDVQSEALKTAVSDLLTDLNQFPENGYQQLWNMLIKPIQAKIGNSKRLVIIPHNFLNNVPFSALYDGKNFLVDHYILSILPSASSISFISKYKEGKGNSTLIFGNPTLDPIYSHKLGNLNYAKAEATKIAELYKTNPYVGQDATETLFRLKAPSANLIHIAAHATFNTENPTLSSLYLAPDDTNDGILSVNEIYELDLTTNRPTVVLSACNSLSGELQAGDAVFGLGRAFMLAGASTVIGTFWQVNDNSTELLMDKYYTLILAGQTKALALQQAQIMLRSQEDGKFAAPYYWSGFVLMGDVSDIIGSSTIYHTNPPATPLENLGGTVHWDIIAYLGLGTLGVLLIFFVIITTRKKRH